MSVMKRALLLLAIGLCLQLGWGRLALAEPAMVKELNFVFLHGAGGNACSLQLLSDSINEQIAAYVADYEQANPDTEVRVNRLLRCYPNDVALGAWAVNIATSINDYLPDAQNLILIGHSMGGKAALYAVANNVGGLADRTAMVVTIDSPIRSLQKYYFTGGASLLDYYRALGLLSAQGVADSIIYYDSSEDGRKVAAASHWLAFIAAESAPFSPQFNVGGIDVMPRNMDDTIIPISAQYADSADVVYYGEHSHNDFAESEEVAGSLAGQILDYIFGGEIECSVLVRGGSLEHAADWLPGTDYWRDVVGEVLVSSGHLEHSNDSFFGGQEWQDVVGESPPGSTRSSYRVVLGSHLPFMAGLEEARWLSLDDAGDCRLYLETRAGPRSTVRVDWQTYRMGLLVGTERDHYEVDIATGTPLTTIRYVTWLSSDPRDLRLRISSEAESPFRWFEAEWRVYAKEGRYRQVIDQMVEMPALEALASSLDSSCCG